MFHEEHNHAQFGNKKAFDLSNDIRIWEEKDAASLLNAHVKFLNYYFIDLCKYKKGQSNSLLTVFEEKISRQEPESWIVVNDELIDLISKYLKIHISYLDLRKIKT